MSKLTRIFASVLGVPEERVTPELSPENESAWDSLNAIILVTEIENAYAIRFTYDEAMGVKNFGDAMKLVESKGGNPNA
ncbi:MAG TPA: acyl carrier protein [Candidatus Paceibacterota bacterium]|jgi:acyl carrier protein|nr:acyl carrier protein [Candidatus Paceibacterota bacterium]